MVPIESRYRCARKTVPRHYHSGNWYYTLGTQPHLLIPSAATDFTGSSGGNRHYATSTIGGPPLYRATRAYGGTTVEKLSVVVPTEAPDGLGSADGDKTS